MGIYTDCTEAAGAIAHFTSQPPVALEQRPRSQTAFCIHIENAHGRSANGRRANDSHVGHTEMLFPGVLTRVGVMFYVLDAR
jgi:hypothetical protein